MNNLEVRCADKFHVPGCNSVINRNKFLKGHIFGTRPHDKEIQLHQSF